jgi:hypothetical protein
VHPWYGRRLPVWRRYRRVSGEYVMVEGPEERRQLLPIEWTDLVVTPSCPVIEGRPVLFDGGRLVAAVRLLQNLRTSCDDRQSATEGEAARKSAEVRRRVRRGPASPRGDDRSPGDRSVPARSAQPLARRARGARRTRRRG